MLGSLEQIQSCHTESHSLLFGSDMILKEGLMGKVSSQINKYEMLDKSDILPCNILKSAKCLQRLPRIIKTKMRRLNKF